MSYKRSKYFTTLNKKKIKYLLVKKNSQITVVFFHGFMSDMIGKKPTAIQRFCRKQGRAPSNRHRDNIKRRRIKDFWGGPLGACGHGRGLGPNRGLDNLELWDCAPQPHSDLEQRLLGSNVQKIPRRDGPERERAAFLFCNKPPMPGDWRFKVRRS